MRDRAFLYQEMLNSIPNLWYILTGFYKNTEGKYRGCNKHFAEEIIGLPTEKITGRVFGELTDPAPQELIKI
jgi:hypothetical protein